MSTKINIDEFKRFSPAVQEELRVELLTKSAAANNASIFNNITKNPGYLSEWSNNIIEINTSVDRTKNKSAVFDLNKMYLKCDGEYSLFTGVKTLVTFPNLTQSVKVYLNNLDVTFANNTEKASVITNVLNDALRFFSYMIQAKGVFRLEDLTRDDFTDFIVEMKAKGGWTNLLHLDDSLHNLINDIKENKIKLSDVCNSRYNNGSYRISIRRDNIDMYTGIPGSICNLPRWFYDDLLQFHSDKYSVNTGVQSCFTASMAYSHIKSINRLYDLPYGFDKPKFRPYPDSIATAYNITGNEPNRLLAKKSDGRTANLSLDDALKMFKEALAWIHDYAEGVFAILELFRRKLEEWIPQFDSDYSAAQKRFSNDSDIFKECARLCQDHKLPFENVVTTRHSSRYDEDKCPCLLDLVNIMQTACFIIIAVNHGRRLNEIVGEHQLKYGLYFGCISPSEEVKDLYFIDIYIEKTIKDYATFYVNKLVLDSVKTLEHLSQIFRPLFSEPKVYNTDILAARKDKLFISREFSPKGFESAPNSYHFASASALFYKRAGVVNLEIDHRAQPFRRFFGLLYYYRYDLPDLASISYAFAHLDPGTTLVYVTDPQMRKSADRIENQYYRRIEEESMQVQADMDDVRSEMFATTIIEILKGDRRGGIWPQMVLYVYDNLSKHAEFNELDLRDQGNEVASKMWAEGYQRIPFEQGGCNLGINEITLSTARCKRDDEDFAHIEDACPELCVGCQHHDSTNLNILRLRDKSDRLREIEEDYSKPQFIRIGSRDQRQLLDLVIESELKIEIENLNLMHHMMNEFTKIGSGILMIEGV